MAAAEKDVRRQLPGEKESQERLESVIADLEREAQDRIGKRQSVEERWLEDLRNFHGAYEEKVVSDLRDAKKSTLFINLTRAKTNAMEARLSDMLFPTDDRNWGISPTPVPELTVEAENIAMAAAEAALALVENPDDPARVAQAQSTEIELAAVHERLDEAKKRARAMEEEIDDHLRECDYAIQARDVIRDGCKLGTGVFKGPVTGGHYKRSWQRPEAAMDQGAYQIAYESDERPMYWRVDPWNFFPDMDASSMDDNERVFERHMLNKKQLRKLAKRPGFDPNAIRRLLEEDTNDHVPSYMSALRSITGAYDDLIKGRYQVWEYHGPIEGEDLERLAVAIGDTSLLDDIGEEVDPLDEVHVVIWFCQGKLLKLGIHQLDSNDPIYSVFNLEKDEATMFGFGIPYIMRDPQKALAAAWRTVMDNMGLSAGPQIIINDDTVEPVDGDWKLTGRKIWRRKAGAQQDKRPFETFDIPSHLNDLMATIDLIKRNIDEETAMPMIAQGEQGAQVTKTAQGMGMLMNSVNVVFRRIVKNWDDDITHPTITRMYDWLMQFSKKSYIKGDYQVDARGTSVLLVREMQSANLLTFLNLFSGHPKLDKFLKEEGLPAMRALSKTMMVPADEVIKSDAEIREDEAKAASQPLPPDPEMEKIAAQMNVAKMEGDLKLELAHVQRETALIELAARNNMELDKLRAMLADRREERLSKERIFAAEAAVEQRQQREGRDTKGSGGYIS